jgi:calmodulin
MQEVKTTRAKDDEALVDPETGYSEVYYSIRELFKFFDADGDGFITKAEFKYAMKQQNPKLTLHEIEALAVRMDTNKDGNIDFREFLAFEIFKRFDADGDGEITLTEFKEGMKGINPTLPQKEVEALFEKMDTNKDGQIDFKEFDAWW